MPRPTKYTEATIERLEHAIGLGASYVQACGYAGISFQTFNEWRSTNPAFSDRLQKAEAQGVVGWLTKIEKAATDGNWQAAAWKLERRYPADYGRREAIEHTGKDGGPIQTRGTLTAEEQAERIAALFALVQQRRDEQ
jgi:hypothetical protein